MKVSESGMEVCGNAGTARHAHQGKTVRKKSCQRLYIVLESLPWKYLRAGWKCAGTLGPPATLTRVRLLTGSHTAMALHKVSRFN
jgi:hypothetical protein